MACAEREVDLAAVISRAADAIHDWPRWRIQRMHIKREVAERTGISVYGGSALPRDDEPETADTIISRVAGDDLRLWLWLSNAALDLHHERYGPSLTLQWGGEE